MAVVTTWWSPQQVAGLLGGPPLARRGAFGGQCHHVTCTQRGADWYNKSNGRYYCDSCARGINDMCEYQGEARLCELHI